MRNNRVPGMILKWNPLSRKREGKSREQWVDGMRRSMISKDPTEEDAKGQRIMAKQNFLGMKDTYVIVEKPLIQ